MGFSREHCILLKKFFEKVYALNQEDYEFYYEIDYHWMLPYQAIAEFLVPIIMVFNSTFGEDECLGFISYYYNHQDKDGYDDQNKLLYIEYSLTNLILKNEFKKKNFCDSCQSLLESEIKPCVTARTLYMTEIAIQFLEKIQNKDPEVSPNFEMIEIKKSYLDPIALELEEGLHLISGVNSYTEYIKKRKEIAFMMAEEKLISLDEAMESQDSKAITWLIPGLHIDTKEIPKDADVHSTFVLRLSNLKFQVGANWTIPNTTTEALKHFYEFSSLDELKEALPNLTKQKGSLLTLY